MRLIALVHIGQEANEDSPSIEFAIKGQELLVVEDLTKKEDISDFQKEYKYICQDVAKRYGTFYVKENEVKII